MATNTKYQGAISVVRARKRADGVFDVFLTVGNDDPLLVGRIERYERPYYLDDSHSPRSGWKVIENHTGNYCGVAETKAEALLWLARRNRVEHAVVDAGRVVGLTR